MRQVSLTTAELLVKKISPRVLADTRIQLLFSPRSSKWSRSIGTIDGDQVAVASVGTELVGSPTQIRQLIKARIDAGRLPCALLYEVFGRKGDGLRCACCDAAITREQIEYDLEIFSPTGALTTLPMHPYCYYAWHEISASIRCGEVVAS